MTFHTFVQLGWGVKGKKKKITKPWGWGLLSWWVLNSAWPRHAALLAARKEGNTKEKNVLFVFRATFCPFHLLPGQSQPTATSPSLTPGGLNPQTSQMEDLSLLKPFLHVCGGKKRWKNCHEGSSRYPLTFTQHCTEKNGINYSTGIYSSIPGLVPVPSLWVRIKITGQSQIWMILCGKTRKVGAVWSWGGPGINPQREGKEIPTLESTVQEEIGFSRLMWIEVRPLNTQWVKPPGFLWRWE